MMQKLGIWLVSIAAAGIAASVLAAVSPEKGRKTIKFAGGLIVIMLVLQPIRSLSGFSLPDLLSNYETALSQRLANVAVDVEEEAEAITVRTAEAFLNGKLEEMGVSAQITLQMGTDENGRRILYSATVDYELPPDDGQIQSVGGMIEAQTGIPPSRQRHR